MHSTRTIALGALLASITLAGNVLAGAAITGKEVTISRPGLSGGGAHGVLWQVRNSSDSGQYIGCKTMGPNTWCAARDRDGYTKSCYSNDLGVAEAVRTVQPTSLLSFSVRISDGRCVTLSVDNDSRYLPGPSYPELPTAPTDTSSTF